MIPNAVTVPYPRQHRQKILLPSLSPLFSSRRSQGFFPSFPSPRQDRRGAKQWNLLPPLPSRYKSRDNYHCPLGTPAEQGFPPHGQQQSSLAAGLPARASLPLSLSHS
eukprot:Sspe_Gene.88824::Locus_60748_Transcript_1_1_Confidence_1.000_Length_454::g.88824::m.88824